MCKSEVRVRGECLGLRFGVVFIGVGRRSFRGYSGKCVLG